MEYLTFKTESNPYGRCVVHNNQFFEAKQVNVTAGEIFFDSEGNLYIPDLTKPLNSTVACGEEEFKPAFWNTSINNILEDKTVESK